MTRVTGMDVRLRSIAGPKQRELLKTMTETAQAAENKRPKRREPLKTTKPKRRKPLTTTTETVQTVETTTETAQAADNDEPKRREPR